MVVLWCGDVTCVRACVQVCGRTRCGRVVRGGARVGGALRRPVAVARAPRRHRARPPRQGHLAALPQVSRHPPPASRYRIDIMTY